LYIRITQLHEGTNLYMLCSDVVYNFLSSKYCILLIGVFMLLFVIL